MVICNIFMKYIYIYLVIYLCKSFMGYFTCCVINYVMFLLNCCVEQVSCTNEELIVDDGEMVNAECIFSHAGPPDAGWRVNWVRKDTGDILPSTSHDVFGRVRRVLMLAARYPESAGEYVCNVSSRRPIYVDSCTTRIRVQCKDSFLNVNHETWRIIHAVG